MSKQTLLIIDYGSGNLRSAAKAFEHVGAEVTVSARAEDVLKADRIVLPGQGAFGDCVNALNGVDGMRDALEEAVQQKGVPFLGICVGMQLLASRGLEHGMHEGLDWISGEVIPLEPSDPALKIPHMGWNPLYYPRSAAQDNQHFLLRNIEISPHYYFVHSFVMQCKDSNHIIAQADYGGAVTAAVARDNIAGVQFHPEKSQKAGLELLRNFLHWKP